MTGGGASGVENISNSLFDNRPWGLQQRGVQISLYGLSGHLLNSPRQVRLPVDTHTVGPDLGHVGQDRGAARPKVDERGALARHLADVYARNGQALKTLLAIRVGGDGDLHEQLYRTCCSVFTDWARGRMDDEVLSLAADVYASVVLTFIERSAAKPLTDKELAAIDRARELFIEGFGAR